MSSWFKLLLRKKRTLRGNFQDFLRWPEIEVKRLGPPSACPPKKKETRTKGKQEDLTKTRPAISGGESTDDKVSLPSKAVEIICYTLPIMWRWFRWVLGGPVFKELRLLRFEKIRFSIQRKKTFPIYINWIFLSSSFFEKQCIFYLS